MVKMFKSHHLAHRTPYAQNKLRTVDILLDIFNFLLERIIPHRMQQGRIEAIRNISTRTRLPKLDQ